MGIIGFMRGLANDVAYEGGVGPWAERAQARA
jgi:hypothetical protein